MLLTVRTSANKYNKELPQVLDDGGGAGETEEMMMWYALNHEKYLEESEPGPSERGDEPWADQKWRLAWFRRMERRE
jgi:hypothetical protein